MRKDYEIKSIQYLGAKWKKKVKEAIARGEDVDDIENYACNSAFYDLVDIEDIEMLLPKNCLEYAFLQLLKRMTMREGTAYYIGSADILTNLAIKAGEVEEFDEW